jgi:hypothetical protein
MSKSLQRVPIPFRAKSVKITFADIFNKEGKKWLSLFPNHLHLLFKTGSTPIAMVMIRLLTGYAVTGKSLRAVIFELAIPAGKNSLANSKPPFHLPLGIPRLGSHPNRF